MTASIGRFGPFIAHGGKFYSIGKDNDPYTIEAEPAIEIILAKRKRDSEKLIKAFDENAELKVLKGRWGPFIALGKEFYRIPKDKEPSALTYEECMALIEEQNKHKTHKKPKKAESVKKPKKETAEKKVKKTKKTKTKVKKTATAKKAKKVEAQAEWFTKAAKAAFFLDWKGKLKPDWWIIGKITPILDIYLSIRDSYLSIRDSYLSIRDNYLSIHDNYLSIHDNYLSIHDNYLSIQD